ncbi:MAG: glucose-1-phosphate cytidylyltransferase [Verrucomicrobiota bacterium]
MKAVILAGGLGSRLSEETVTRPKPMVEIGGRPILWHIMNIFATNGITEFIVALGYKGEMVKQYFLNFNALNSDVSVDLSTGNTTIHRRKHPDWKVHLVDTGLETNTGGRLRRLGDWLCDDETFMFTYGDGLTDLNIRSVIKHHEEHAKLATVTAVRSPARFGRLSIDGGMVRDFNEKPDMGEGWINGGYFVLHKKVLSYIDDDQTAWEREPMERLARDGQLVGYPHTGFWSCMDTLKEKNMLEQLWSSGNVPWKTWKGVTA